MTDILVSAIARLISGIIASPIAPWVQWAVEKRRKLFNYRRELVKTWREEIESFDHESGNIRGTATYSAIRPHLKQAVRDSLESPRTVYVEIDSRSGVDGFTGKGKKAHLL
jgi:hypothetical protein